MVHWDLEGHEPHAPSGLEILVTVYEEADAVRQGKTTTVCILFDMEGLDADRIHASEPRDVLCVWTGAAHHTCGGDFETVEVAMERTGSRSEAFHLVKRRMSRRITGSEITY